MRELVRNYLQNNSLIFFEHYPVRSKEQELYAKPGLTEVVVYSSLDEALFTHIGGDRIIDLVKQMGMKEEEALQHPTITSAINKAQEKIEAKLTVDQSARSAAEWFRINLPQL